MACLATCPICAFFNGFDEQPGCPSLVHQRGVSRGRQAFHIVDPELFGRIILSDSPSWHRRGAAIATGHAGGAGVGRNAYLRDDRCFDQMGCSPCSKRCADRGRAAGNPPRHMCGLSWNRPWWTGRRRKLCGILIRASTYRVSKYNDPVSGT